MKILSQILGDKEGRRIGKNFTSLLILQGANFLLPLITLPYLVRVLGTEMFGLIMFAQAFVLFFNILVDFGFNLSATREISLNRIDPDKQSIIFSGVFIIKSLLIVVALLIISGIVFLIPRFSNDWEIYFLSFGIVIGQALFPVWYFQGIEKMSIITLINTSAKVIFTGLILIFVKNESDYLLVPIFNSLGFILAGIIGLLLALKNIRFVKPGWQFTKGIFLDSSQLFISTISVTLYTSANTILLGLFTNNAMVGVYASMEKLVIAIKNLYAPFFQAIFPWMSGRTNSEVILITKSLAKVLGSIGLVAFGLIFFFADTILKLIYDNPLITEYSIVFQLLGLIAPFSALNMLYNMLFLSTLKRYSERMKIIIFAGILNLLLASSLGYYFAIYGISIAATSTEFILLSLGWYYFNKIKNETLKLSNDKLR